MSYHKKNLNLQDENGETLNIYLDGSKTVIEGRDEPIELATTANVCITGGAAGDCLDVVSSINRTNNKIATEVSEREGVVSTQKSLRISSINSVISARSTAISTEANQRAVAITGANTDIAALITTEKLALSTAISTQTSSRESAIVSIIDARELAIATAITARADAINSLSAEISTNKKGGDDNGTELSAQISTVQSSINGILNGSNINLNSFSEIVAAYENSDTGLQEYLDDLDSRLAIVENELNTLTKEPAAPALLFTTETEANDYGASLMPDSVVYTQTDFTQVGTKWTRYKNMVEGTDEIATAATIAHIDSLVENVTLLESTDNNTRRKARELAEWAALSAALEIVEGVTADEYRTNVLDPAHAQAEADGAVWPVPADPETLYSYATYSHREYFRFVEHDGALIADIYYMLNPS